MVCPARFLAPKGLVAYKRDFGERAGRSICPYKRPSYTPEGGIGVKYYVLAKVVRCNMKWGPTYIFTFELDK